MTHPTREEIEKIANICDCEGMPRQRHCWVMGNKLREILSRLPDTSASGEEAAKLFYDRFLIDHRLNMMTDWMEHSLKQFFLAGRASLRVEVERLTSDKEDLIKAVDSLKQERDECERALLRIQCFQSGDPEGSPRQIAIRTLAKFPRKMLS